MKFLQLLRSLISLTMHHLVLFLAEKTEVRSAHVALNSTGKRFVYCSKVHQVETCRVVVVELKKRIHDVAEESQTEDDENADDEHYCSRSRDQCSLQNCSQDALYAIYVA